MSLAGLIARARETGVAPHGAPDAVVKAAEEGGLARAQAAADALKKAADDRKRKAVEEPASGRTVVGYVVALNHNLEPDVFVTADDADDRHAAAEVALRRLGIITTEKQPEVETVYGDAA